MNKREHLGRLVREIWIEWAKEQPVQKKSWLVEWDDLPECDKEVDRRIGVALWREGMSDACDIITKNQIAWSGELNRLITEASKTP